MEKEVASEEGSSDEVSQYVISYLTIILVKGVKKNP